MKTKRKNSLMKAGVLSAAVLALSIGFIPSVVAYSTEQAEEVILEETAESAVFEKTEVVYATLTPEGSTKGIYVINQFDVERAGKIVDFGSYATVANLTDQGKIDFSGNEAAFNAGEGAFYYQGNVAVDGAELPWDVHLSYMLDGAAVSPEELAGESGALSVHVTTSPAAGVDQAFYKSYMLQISFTLNGDTTTDIVAEGATVASAGRNRTVAFTVLPGRNADCVLSAKVVDFEMSGVQIAALPYSMAMEMPGTDGLTEGIGQLSDAVSAINDGAGQLADGVSQLSSGAAELSNGSSEFGAGLLLLNESAGSLVEGSKDFNDAFQAITGALEDLDVGDLENMDAAQLASYLETTASSLQEMADGLQGTYSAYYNAYRNLDAAMGSLESAVSIVTKEDISIVEEAANAATATESATKLIGVYNAASAAVGKYDANAFEQANSALEQFGQGSEMYEDIQSTVRLLNTVAGFLKDDEQVGSAIEQMGELVAGMKELAGGYAQFHGGLEAFAAGLNELTVNYASLDEGMAELASGVSELDEGTAEFAAGVSEFNTATIDLPETMRAEIEAMMADYVFPEFDPISFVDSRNDANMAAVQFVLTTEAIEAPEPEAAEEAEEEEQTVVDRFFALFQ